MTQVQIYDTTLRDGTQREGLSITCNDKLRIAQLLDNLGVAYIEGGWPGSNPKDAEHFFDGFRANNDYALATLQAAVEGGTDSLTLCDTNGGSLTWQIEDAVN